MNERRKKKLPQTSCTCNRFRWCFMTTDSLQFPYFLRNHCTAQASCSASVIGVRTSARKQQKPSFRFTDECNFDPRHIYFGSNITCICSGSYAGARSAPYSNLLRCKNVVRVRFCWAVPSPCEQLAQCTFNGFVSPKGRTHSSYENNRKLRPGKFPHSAANFRPTQIDEPKRASRLHTQEARCDCYWIRVKIARTERATCNCIICFKIP